jgi:hypothetical protein
MDPSSSGNGAPPGFPRVWLYGVASLYAVAFLIYAAAWAFTFDTGYHLLAAQLVGAGKTPYIDFCFPQTPFNVYLNAGWMRIAGGSWHAPQVLGALFTIGAVLLTADYVMRRFPVGGWRMAGAIVAVLGIGLNGAVFVYGPLQAYGICLFGLAAGFRLAVRAVDGEGWLPSAAAGFCAGMAAASSLLSAAAAPVLLFWMVFYTGAGRRWKTFAAFAIGVSLPFAPVFWLLARAPRQTWFNLFRYHAYFRALYWPETTRHDLEILTSWIDNGQALVLGLLALGGLIYVVRQSGWPERLKTEFYLCAWLAAALAAEVSRAHPTFARYFLLTVPFATILAVAGLFAVSRAFATDRPLWPVLAVAALFTLGLGKTLYDRREVDDWSNYQRVADKIDQVTPRNAPVYAVEALYFLTRRTPPSGYELNSYTHLVALPPAEAALMHIVSDAEVKRQFQAGKFATAYACDDDEITGNGLKALYKQSVEMEECTVFWDLKK